jgi:hypothetical protein
VLPGLPGQLQPSLALPIALGQRPRAASASAWLARATVRVPTVPAARRAATALAVGSATTSIGHIQVNAGCGQLVAVFGGTSTVAVGGVPGASPAVTRLPPGFSCVTTITLAFLSNGHPIRYVPIDYVKRSGRSKFHPVRDAYNYVIQVLRMVMYFNPLRVLMPVGLTLMGATLVKLVSDLVRHDLHVAGSTVLVGLAAFNIMAIALLADLVVRRTASE